MSALFKDVVVLDLTKVFSGPFATRMLADYGAEVIKIEDKEHYDDSRDYPPLKNNWSGYFELLNRNKKGISLNLKNAYDLDHFYRLVKRADVIVENLTPPTKTKLKIDYATVTKINPKIVYASLSGISQTENKKYYDIIAQAESGLLSLSGTEKIPMKIGPSVVDAFSGMTLAFGISAALFKRKTTKKGCYLDVSMLSSAMNLLESNLIGYSVSKKDPVRTGNVDNLISPFGVYKTKNGYVALAIGNNTQWEIFSSFLAQHRNFSKNNYRTNSLRLKNAKALTALIEETFSRYSTSEIVTRLSDLNIACSPVNSMSDVAKNEDLFRNQALVITNHKKLGKTITSGRPIKFSDEKIFKITPAPDIGENNKEYGI